MSANQLGVCGLLAPPRSGDLCSIFNSSPCGGSAITPQSIDEGGVNSQLGTSEQREAAHNDLEPSAISNCSWEGKIEITHQRVGCDPTASSRQMRTTSKLTVQKMLAAPCHEATICFNASVVASKRS